MEGSTDSSPPVPRSEPSGGPTQTSSQWPVRSTYLAPQNHEAQIASVLEDLRRRRRVPRLLTYAAVLHALATPVAIVEFLVLVLPLDEFYRRSGATWARTIRDLVDYSQLIVVTQILFAGIAAIFAISYRRDQPPWWAKVTIIVGGLIALVSFLLAIDRFPFREIIGLVGTSGGLLSLVAGLEASEIRAPSAIRPDAFLATPVEQKMPPPPPSSPP